MAATVELLNPRHIEKNKSNPRLIFREDELTALADSIRDQGILVPLTVYKQRDKYVLLDGERRWRCAVRLGLNKVPAIVQEKPDPVTNIMMMFAIHNARRDWDPLPTAMKLEELEKKLTSPGGRGLQLLENWLQRLLCHQVK
jgi:ParB/RepB/Spo0J family partition protein